MASVGRNFSHGGPQEMGELGLDLLLRSLRGVALHLGEESREFKSAQGTSSRETPSLVVSRGIFAYLHYNN